LDRRDDINTLGKLFCSPSFDFILLPFKTLLLVALLLVDSYSEADPWTGGMISILWESCSVVLVSTLYCYLSKHLLETN
jgi:hypothetical protein